MSSFEKKILILAVVYLLLIAWWYVVTKKSPSKERFGETPPEISETSSYEPIRSYGTLLKNVPQVKNIASKFATVRGGKFRGTDDIILPSQFDGRVVWADYLTPVTSQGSCGNCWAHATTSALADRFAIFSLGKIKFVPSPYEITVCAHKFTDISTQWGNTGALKLMDDYLHGRKIDPSNELQSAACEGASLFTAAEVLYTDGVPELSCFPSKGEVDGNLYNVSETPTENPSNLPYCLTLETMDFDTCVDQTTAAKKYRAKTAYNVGDPTRDNLDDLEHSIMYEIYKRGPIPTGFMVFSDFMDSFDGKTVYTHPDKYALSNGGHAVKIVGWGNDGVDSLGNTDIPYWILQNSWGTEWGEGGFFKIKRKIVECQLEQNVLGMIPDFPGITISDPNIIPIETSQDINSVISFPQHYLDPYTGYYLSGIEKIKNCKLQGNVVPYIDPTIPLPSYSTFYAAQISDYLKQNPLPTASPLVPSVVCKTSSENNPTQPVVPIPSPIPASPSVVPSESTPIPDPNSNKIFDRITSNKYIFAIIIISIVIVGSCALWKIMDLFHFENGIPGSIPLVPSVPTFNSGYVGQSYL